jgi:hypothetical protein
MRTQRLAVFALIALGALATAGCYDGNSTATTEAPVFLSVDVPTGVGDVFMSTSGDVSLATVTFTSHSKSPTGTLSQQQDVILSEWVVTCSRTDGGTVASPQWRLIRTIYVPADGSVNAEGFPIFPFNNFSQAPLLQLFPENGGYDKETGNSNIRQRLHIEVFGKTVAGQAVSVGFDVNVNFFY